MSGPTRANRWCSALQKSSTTLTATLLLKSPSVSTVHSSRYLSDAGRSVVPS
jgi:hypothetical protein